MKPNTAGTGGSAEWVFHPSFTHPSFTYLCSTALPNIEINQNTGVSLASNIFSLKLCKYWFSSHSSIPNPSANASSYTFKIYLESDHFSLLHPDHHIWSKLSSSTLTWLAPNQSPCFCPWPLNLNVIPSKYVPFVCSNGLLFHLREPKVSPSQLRPSIKCSSPHYFSAPRSLTSHRPFLNDFRGHKEEHIGLLI